MRISEIFTQGGGTVGSCDRCIDAAKGNTGGDYIFGGYPRYFNIYQGGTYGKYDYTPPPRLCGSIFY